ncbi:MAG: lamin tail domain-containing protein, partial [Akkermansiaceae bacterium]
MNASHSVWQDLGSTYQANTIYTLTVSHGHRSGSTGNSNQSTFSLRSSNNTVFASAFENSFSLAGSSFADSTPLTLDTSATPAAVGQTIRIHLFAGGGGRSHFDNIRLDATEIEPDGTARLSNSAATAIGSSTATLNGTITDVGDEAPSITLFYGISDGGTVAGAWDSSVTIGFRDGNFSSSISGLLPAQSYFFSARATNSAGESWAIPSLDFETLPLPPTVSQSAASDITAISAQLTGSITDNGGDNTTLTFYYGPSDGGTTPANWGNSISLGIVNGTSSIELNGLTSTSSYFFRAMAANSGGITWATATGTFTTIAVTTPFVENRSAGGIAATSANLRGEVTDTGSSPPTVTIFFGTSDGGNDPNSWDSSISVGTESGDFSRFVSGLLAETTYFYTARASNAAGTTWASSSENFDTPAALPSQVVINEIHYDPANETSAEEFIELYNPGANVVDLSNWELTDAVQFTFPAGTTLGAGAYLVIAEDPA